MVRYCSAECQKSHWETHKKDCSELKRFEKLKNFSTEIVAVCAELGDYEAAKELSNLNPAQQQYFDAVFGKALKNKTLRDLYKKAAIAEREHGLNSTEWQAAAQVYEQAKDELWRRHGRNISPNFSPPKTTRPRPGARRCSPPKTTRPPKTTLQRPAARRARATSSSSYRRSCTASSSILSARPSASKSSARDLVLARLQ